MPPYLQVFLVVVVHDGQEDRHEDVRVDEDVQDEEYGEDEAGVVGGHPANDRRGIQTLETQRCSVRSSDGSNTLLSTALL